jgi:hypothetical protein
MARYYAQILAGTMYTRALSMNISPKAVRGRIKNRGDLDEKLGTKVESDDFVVVFRRQLIESLDARIELGVY